MLKTPTLIYTARKRGLACRVPWSDCKYVELAESLQKSDLTPEQKETILNQITDAVLANNAQFANLDKSKGDPLLVADQMEP